MSDPFLRKELRRMGLIDDEGAPTNPGPDSDVCPNCGAPLQTASGYVGEDIVYCPNGDYHWEDSIGAVARVI